MKYITFLLIMTMTAAQPFTVLAVTETPTVSPSPTIEETVTVTPVPELSPTPETESVPEEEDLTSPSPTPVQGLTPTAVPEIEEVTDLLTESILTTEEATSSGTMSEVITPIPTMTIQAPAIQTGDVENTVAVDNIINTNVTGNDNCMLILSHNFNTQDIIDLTDSCQNVLISTTPAVQNDTVNNNDADVQTTIQAIADTGKNVLFVPSGIIETGDSRVQVDLFNLINTNLTGTNTLFGVINLFDSQEGDIILPYEFDYVLQDLSVPSATFVTDQLNEQTADIGTEVETLVNTGANTGAEHIVTGDASTTIHLYDKINTSIFGSNFLILEINTFGNWDGQLLGWWGDAVTNDNQIVAVYNGLNSVSHPQSIQNQNSASVKNSIQVIANTGANIASDGATISTGNADATVNVFDFVNTNITGNNWYHVVVNIFDSFKGNIIFPRPDLAVSTTADKSSVQQGDTVTFQTNFSNEGILFARNTVLETVMPDTLEFIEASAGGIFSNGLVRWDLGTLARKEFGSVWFLTRAKEDSNKLIPLKTTIRTETDEPEKENNISYLSLIISFIASSEKSENTALEQSEVPIAYLQKTKMTVPIEDDYTTTQNTFSSGTITAPQQKSKNQTNILGERTSKPITKAETFSPLFFMLLYLTGSGIIIFKEWLEG